MFNYKSWSSVGIFIAIVIVLNMIVSNVGGRFDFTRNNVYTMSDVTKDVLNGIGDPVTVKIYYSEKFPKELINVKQYVFDLLEEYKAYAGSGLEYEFLEIGEGADEIKREAQSYGVMPVQANIAENDQFKVQQVYLGIAFIAGDSKEALPFIQKIDQLEYDFTGAIKRLASGGKPKVAFFTGNDEASFAPANPYARFNNQNKKEDKVDNLKAKLSEQYDLEEVDLSKVGKVPDNITVAIMVNPKKEISEQSRYLIDQYLMRGGKLALYINQQTVDLENQIIPVMDNRHGMSDFLRNYGLELKNNLIIDKNSLMVTVPQRVGPIVVQVQKEYPFFPKVTEFNKTHPIVSRLNEMSVFYASSIDSVPGKNVKYTPLVYSSEKSGIAFKDQRSNMYNIQPDQQFFYNQKNMTLAAVVEGSFTSSFQTKPDTVKYEGQHTLKAEMPGKILLVGDADFAKDDYQAPGNAEFFLNTVDWLVDENGLISIRSKKIDIKPLDKEITKAEAAGTRSFIKAINVFLAPVILIIFGLMRWVIRKKAKQMAVNQ